MVFFSKGLEVAERRANSHDRPGLNAVESTLGIVKQGRLVGSEHSWYSGGVIRAVVLLVIRSASSHLTVTLETVTVSWSAIADASPQAMWSSGEFATHYCWQGSRDPAS